MSALLDDYLKKRAIAEASGKAVSSVIEALLHAIGSLVSREPKADPWKEMSIQDMPAVSSRRKISRDFPSWPTHVEAVEKMKAYWAAISDADAAFDKLTDSEQDGVRPPPT